MPERDSNVVPLKPPRKKRSARKDAIPHLEAALNTEVRGRPRALIQEALEICRGVVRKDLLHTQYEALRPGDTMVDPDRPGFLARCTSAGVRLVYRHNDPVNGSRRETLIGYLALSDESADGTLTLAGARDEWQRMKNMRDRGERPVVVAAEPEPVETDDTPTMKQMVLWYLGRYAEKVKRSWKDDEYLLTRYVLDAGYGDMPASRFTHEIVEKILRDIDGEGKPTRQSEKVRAVISTMFNVAKGKTSKLRVDAWLPKHFVNPVDAVSKVKRKVTVAKPDGNEIQTYAEQLRTGTDLREDIHDALMLQLLLTARVSEITGMSWSEVDLRAHRWTLPAERSKNGDAHEVFLSEPALAILRRRKKAATTSWVFPGARGKALRSDVVQHALANNRAALGVSVKFTSHSVRHAFASWAGENLKPVPVVDRCMAHKTTGGINAVYNESKLQEPAKALWTEWAEFLS